MSEYKFSKNCVMRLKLANTELPEEENERIVETAGFVPLDVKFKQFEQNGIRAQLVASDFDSSDMRQIYFGENNTIYPNDDIETVNEKLLRQALTRQQILKTKTSAATPPEVAKADAAADSTENTVDNAEK